MAAIAHVHLECHTLCEQSFGNYLPNAGNMGIFCHYNEEYDRLIAIRNELCEPSDNPDQKYFKLYQPITIPVHHDVPETTYTHLYIRRPDPYRHHVGDVDFYLEQAEYDELKQSLSEGTTVLGARVFPRNDLDMIELYDPDIDVLAYVSTNMMSEKVHVKLSDETRL